MVDNRTPVVYIRYMQQRTENTFCRTHGRVTAHDVYRQWGKIHSVCREPAGDNWQQEWKGYCNTCVAHEDDQAIRKQFNSPEGRKARLGK